MKSECLYILLKIEICIYWLKRQFAYFCSLCTYLSKNYYFSILCNVLVFISVFYKRGSLFLLCSSKDVTFSFDSFVLLPIFISSETKMFHWRVFRKYQAVIIFYSGCSGLTNVISFIVVTKVYQSLRIRCMLYKFKIKAIRQKVKK